MSNILAGRYIGRATGEVDFSYSTAGNEQVVARFEIMDGEFAGRQVRFFGSFATPESTEIVLRQLRDAGWSGENVTDIGPHNGFGSADVTIQIRYESWNGKEMMKVNIWPIDGGGLVRDGQKLDEARKQALAARLQGAVLKSKRPGTASGAAPPGAPSWASKAASAPAGRQNEEPWNRQPGDDDIPY